MSVVSDSSAG
uniref:Uncharacterized protein n=1 Tax=Arundo donax TaxID=35708 RepID=A0A0A9HGC7_ARUDO